MIIVSQSKRSLINFDNINLIATDGEGAIRARLGINDNIMLGSYSTEERAKEVLNKIIQKIEDTSWTNLMDNLQIAIHDKNFGGALSIVYRMPEE